MNTRKSNVVDTSKINDSENKELLINNNSYNSYDLFESIDDFMEKQNKYIKSIQ